MPQRAIPAVFMRGGTSKAIMLHARDLPAAEEARTALLCAAMGSPDPAGRQLDGMGGGLSSLSKACIIAPSARPDSDVDYTFGQVMIREARVDWRGNCGNMSSAVGPFAVEEGLVRAMGDMSTVRIFNTNTGKLIHATFPLEGGMPATRGDLAIPGVAGTGAPVRLDFLQPGGATTGKLLPSGSPCDWLEVEGVGRIAASLVDAANAACFIRAADVGLEGTELPEALEARPGLLARLDAVRRAASVRMGIAPDMEAARAISTVPYIGLIAPPADAPTLDGEGLRAAEMHLLARVISNGQPHRALPLTVSLCLAVAARIAGTLPHAALRGAPPEGPLRIGMPSGVLTVGAEVARAGEAWTARSGSFFRTARRLFQGQVLVA